MKYYAVRTIDGKVVNKIYTEWSVCQKQVSGHNAIYKSFKSEELAEEYLSSYKEEVKEKDIESNKTIYYVDGSYMNDVIGWGYVKVRNDKQIGSDCGGVKPTGDTSRNITGELYGTMFAVKNAILTGIKEVYIGHDYQGISSFVDGSWEATSKESIKYTKWMVETIDTYKINVNFFKIKGHTDHKWNEVADEMAKLGTEVI